LFVNITELNVLFGEPSTESIGGMHAFLNGMDGIVLLTQC
jgi:hypothetical protein